MKEEPAVLCMESDRGAQNKGGAVPKAFHRIRMHVNPSFPRQKGQRIAVSDGSILLGYWCCQLFLTVWLLLLSDDPGGATDHSVCRSHVTILILDGHISRCLYSARFLQGNAKVKIRRR